MQLAKNDFRFVFCGQHFVCHSAITAAELSILQLRFSCSHNDAGVYLFNTATTGNSNSGHDYGTKLSPDERRDLIEYLKTL
jgi:hypothetical protein